MLQSQKRDSRGNWLKSPFNSLRYTGIRKAKSLLILMMNEMIKLREGLASAGQYANNLHLAADR